MTKRVLLHEAVSAPIAAPGDDGKWLIKLISPGQGSSGHYSQEMLEEYTPLAFPSGTTSYIDHPEEDDNGTPKRSPKDLLGVFGTEPVWSEEHQAEVAEFTPLAHYREWFEAVAPHVGFSIYAIGDQDDDGNVLALHPDVFNTVDLVSYAGRGGGVAEKLFEQAQRVAEDKNSGENASADTLNEGSKLEIKDLADKLDAFIEAFGAKIDGLSTVVESLVPEAPSEIDLEATAEAVIAEESLTPKLRKMVFESVKAGTPVADAVAEAKSIADEISGAKQEHVVEGGRRLSFSEDAGTDITKLASGIAGW